MGRVLYFCLRVLETDGEKEAETGPASCVFMSAKIVQNLNMQ